jgi:hypothetical protein
MPSAVISHSTAPGWRRTRALTRLALALACISLAACRTLPGTIHRPCLDESPPRLDRLVVEGLVSSGCPFGMVCFTTPAAIALGEYLGAGRTWMLMAWLRCGPLPPPANKPGSFGGP